MTDRSTARRTIRNPNPRRIRMAIAPAPNLASPVSKAQRQEGAAAGKMRGLDFLWLELTNRCNLQCVHCYTESHPHSGDRDVLTSEDYESIMRQAYALGCRKIQFIGGEPQLNRDFLHLLVQAREIGFEFIEVFSNLTKLADETVRFAADNGVCFATSVYSNDPSAHDAITTVPSSHARTIGNLKKLVNNGIQTRAGIIAIDQDKAALGRTKHFLRDLGVQHMRSSELRAFGRGEKVAAKPSDMSGLCGHCWAGKLCVAPDGAAYPCVMARQWSVGNVLETPLAEIVRGKPLKDTRQAIYETVWLPKTTVESCPQSCTPNSCPQSCEPTRGMCVPSIHPDCSPDLMFQCLPPDGD